jgi:uncharacterized membrane-anchored protein
LRFRLQLQRRPSPTNHHPIHGPAEIKLLDQASLKLTEDEVFVPSAEANQIMKVLGNGTTPARFGLVTDTKSDSGWMIDVIWVEEGYVRDGDAKEWQADALLESLREGTESSTLSDGSSRRYTTAPRIGLSGRCLRVIMGRQPRSPRQ